MNDRTTQTFEPGQRVRLHTQFLRDTAQYTGEPAPTSWGPFATGYVLDSAPLSGGRSFVSVMWADGDDHHVLNSNLEAI